MNLMKCQHERLFNQTPLPYSPAGKTWLEHMMFSFKLEVRELHICLIPQAHENYDYNRMLVCLYVCMFVCVYVCGWNT